MINKYREELPKIQINEEMRHKGVLHLFKANLNHFLVYWKHGDPDGVVMEDLDFWGILEEHVPIEYKFRKLYKKEYAD